MGKTIFRWRPLTTVVLLGGILAVLVATGVSYVAANFQPKTEVIIGVQPYMLVVASDDVSREKGLSGVAKLGGDEGLLMVFEEDGLHGIWMKDMLMPIDIIWLDSSKKVIHLVRDADPELSTEVVYTPRKPSRYVIELASGSIKQHGIRLGQEIEFDPSERSMWW